jgi:2-oxoglutarate ferredoxin oxidoreductase subunit alpha
VIIAADGQIGQMMEPAELPLMRPLQKGVPDWALSGAKDRPPNTILSFNLNGADQEKVNIAIQERLALIRANEQRWVEHYTEDAELLVVGYGTTGRIAYTAVETARENGMKVGLLRPQSLFPFPEERISELADNIRSCLVVEMNAGQMLDDVRLAVSGQVPVGYYGRMGGAVPMPEEILEAIEAEYAKLQGV